MIEHQNQLLYPKILWNRPINRATAGRLLIVGGHKSGVAMLQSVFAAANACGIGTITILAPDVLRPMLGAIPEIDFGPSTMSGSLAKLSLGQLQELSSHADTTLIGPNLSNNSETAITIEKFVENYQQPLVVADDALEIVANIPDAFRSRPKTLTILSMQQLFKLAGKLQLPLTIRPDAGINGKVDIVRELHDTLKVDIVLVGPELIVMTNERCSVTALRSQPPTLPAAAYGVMSVFYTQNPSATYEALTTAAFVIKQSLESADDDSQAAMNKALQASISAHEN